MAEIAEVFGETPIVIKSIMQKKVGFPTRKEIAKSAWQPIETAPKDGTTIITWEPDGTGVYFEWWDEDSWHYDQEWGNGSKNPTHWMPLPEPPK